MLYIFNDCSSHSKVHILDGSGRTLCKAENGNVKLNNVTESPPKHRGTCLICKQQLNKKKKKKQKRIKSKKAYKGPPENKHFYQSWEWKKLRYSVLQHYGKKCMCCGASPQDGKVMVVDHIYPIKKFPKLAMDFNNLQVLCNDCNMGKSNDDYTDFREQLPGEGRAHMDSLKIN